MRYTLPQRATRHALIEEGAHVLAGSSPVRRGIAVAAVVGGALSVAGAAVAVDQIPFPHDTAPDDLAAIGLAADDTDDDADDDSDDSDDVRGGLQGRLRRVAGARHQRAGRDRPRGERGGPAARGGAAVRRRLRRRLRGVAPRLPRRSRPGCRCRGLGPHRVEVPRRADRHQGVVPDPADRQGGQPGHRRGLGARELPLQVLRADPGARRHRLHRQRRRRDDQRQPLPALGAARDERRGEGQLGRAQGHARHGARPGHHQDAQTPSRT